MRLKTLPALAVATLVGTGLGVHLGRAAIGAVDPFYFTDPAGTPSYAELVPAASLSRPWSTEIEPDGGGYDWPAPCVGCPWQQAAYEPAPHDAFQDAWTPPRDEASPPYTAVEIEPVLEDEIDAIGTGIEEELRHVERYAYYPVSREAARAHQAAVTDSLEEERPSAGTLEPRRPIEALLPGEPIEISRY